MISSPFTSSLLPSLLPSICPPSPPLSFFHCFVEFNKQDSQNNFLLHSGWAIGFRFGFLLGVFFLFFLVFLGRWAASGLQCTQQNREDFYLFYLLLSPSLPDKTVSSLQDLVYSYPSTSHLLISYFSFFIWSSICKVP